MKAGGSQDVKPSLIHPGYVWLIETVDKGAQPSLALDSQDYPHIAYYQNYTGDLCYARFDGAPSFGTGRWLTETVDAFGLTGIGPSLALDAHDHPHISYRIAGDYGNLCYAHHDGTGWFTETVDAAGNTGAFSSLVLDDQGHPHISYHNQAGCLMYAHHDGTGWQIEVVACGAGWYGWCTSIELNDQGHPRISYCDCWPNDNLMYAWHDGAAWHSELVDPTDGLGTSLALDADGHPHISYCAPCWPEYALSYAWHDGTEWQIAVVDNAGDVGTDSSLALEANPPGKAGGRAHISYHDKTNRALRYAYFDGTSWLTETVDAKGWTGYDTSLALDAQGLPHISYRGSGLKYARLVELPYTVFLPWVER